MPPRAAHPARRRRCGCGCSSLALGALTVYAGYTALSDAPALSRGRDRAPRRSRRNRDRLKANVADLKRQLEQANRARDEVETALKQSRANTDAASAQIGDLQRQVSDLQQKAGDSSARAMRPRRAASEAARRQSGAGRRSGSAQGPARDDAEEARSGAGRLDEGTRAGEPDADATAGRDAASPVRLPT